MTHDQVRSAGLSAVLLLLAGCSTVEETPVVETALPMEPAYAVVNLPANSTVQVTIKSVSCNHLQRTVIHWPDGPPEEFISSTPASPDSEDAGFDSGSPTEVVYGTTSFTTGGGSSTALVEVFDRLPTDSVWKPTLTSVPDSGHDEVWSEGHRNIKKHDWNDTVIIFTFSPL